MPDTLGVGIIGLHMGAGQLRQIANVPGLEITAVCDLEEALVRKLQDEFDIPFGTTDYEELCEHEDVDIVSVATPDYLHLEMAEAAFDSEKHVMMEKPLARTVDECQAMIDAQREAGTKLMTAHVARFYSHFQKIKGWTMDGTLGEVYNLYTSYIHNYENIPGYNEWRFDPDLRHQLIGGGCHAIDLARWIGGEAEEVSCYSNHFNIPVLETDDHFNINIKFQSGTVGTVVGSFGCAHPYNIDMHVWGTNGTVIATNTTDEAKICLRQIDRNKWMDMPAGREAKGLAAEFQVLANAIRNDEEIESDGVSGARTVAIGWAAIKSSREGKPVEPKVDF